MVNFMGGDMNTELELSSAVRECSDVFKPSDVGIIRTMIADHLAATGTSSSAIATAMVTVEAGNVEEQEWLLAMQGLKYDVAAYAAWATRCKDRASHAYFQKLEHLQSRFKRAQEMADEMMRAGGRQRIRVACLDGARGRDPSAEDVTRCMKELDDFLKQICQNQQLGSVDDVVRLLLCMCTLAYLHA